MSSSRKKMGNSALKVSLLDNEADSAAILSNQDYQEASDASSYTPPPLPLGHSAKKLSSSKKKSATKEHEQKEVEMLDSSRPKRRIDHDRAIPAEELEQEQEKAEALALDVRAAEDPQEEDEKIVHNYLVFWSVKFFLAPAAFFGEGTFGYYCDANAAAGTQIVSDVLVENAGWQSLAAFTPIAKFTIGKGSFVCEVINGCTQFEVVSAAYAVDKAIHNASFIRMPYVFCKSLYQHPAYTAYAATKWTLFTAGVLGTAWGDMDEIYNDWLKTFGQAGGRLMLGTLFVGAISYVVLSFGARTAKGIEAWWDVPTKALWQRLKNHRNIAIEMQYLMENVLTSAVRIGSLSFLGGGLAAKVEGLNVSKSAGYLIGGLGGAEQGVDLFWQGTRMKHHKYVDMDLMPDVNAGRARENKAPMIEPVTNAERKVARDEYYANVSYSSRLIEELKRPFVIGLTNSLFALYATKVWLGNTIIEAVITQGSTSEDTAHKIAWSLAGAAALIAYYPHYASTRYRQDNELAVAKRDALAAKNNLAAQAAVVVVPKAEEKQQEEKVSLANLKIDDLQPQEVPGEEKVDMDINFEIMKESLRNVQTQFNQGNYEAALDVLDKTKDDMNEADCVELYAKLRAEVINAIDAKNDAEAEAEEELEAVAEEKEILREQRDEEPARRDLCSEWTGKAAAIGMCAFRVPILINNLVGNNSIGPLLSKATWVVIGLVAGTVVGDNRYRTMTDESVESIKILKGHTVSLLNKFGICRPKPLNIVIVEPALENDVPKPR